MSSQQKIFVDRDARIVMGTDVERAGGPVTEVNQDTFHAQHVSAREEARKYLPPDTRVDMIDGFEVFSYTVPTEFDVPIELAAYSDGTYYQVKLISPEVETAWKNPHTGHLFSDGQLCLSQSYGGGQPTLRQAYAKSVLWAQGIAAMIMGSERFPFSLNNEGD